MAPYCLTIYPALIILRPNTKFSVEPGTFGQLNPHAEAYLAWLAEGNTPDPVELAAEDAPVLQARIATEAQARLDAWAQSRGYDGILSACTYATSRVPRFRTEGQRCVDLRDQTWAQLYEILADVEAGTRPVPLSLAEIEGDLPVLAWND
jgi:hypothetical protein